MEEQYIDDQIKIYVSDKIQDFIEVVQGDQGYILHNDIPIGNVDFTRGEISFEGKEPKAIFINDSSEPIELDSKEFQNRILIALEISESYAVKQTAAQYDESYFKTLIDHSLPENYLVEKVKITRERTDVDNDTYYDMIVLNMLDSNAEVAFIYRENGKYITPSIDIRKLGDIDYYSAIDIEGRSKSKEEEYGKAIDYLSYLPTTLLGKKASNWVMNIYNQSMEMIKQFEMTDYLEPIELEVMCNDSKEILEIQALPLDKEAGAKRLADVSRYITSGNLAKLIKGGANIYKCAEDIVNIQDLILEHEKEKKELFNYFNEKLCPHIHKLYPCKKKKDQPLDLPPQVRHDFNYFINWHKELYDDLDPNNPSNNICLKELFEDKQLLEAQYKILSSLKKGCEDYIAYINSGMSAIEASTCLTSDSFEGQLRNMVSRYNLFPDDLKPEWCDSQTIIDLSNDKLEALHGNSKLIQDIKLNNVIKGISPQKIINGNTPPRIISQLELSWEALEEVYDRSGVIKETGGTLEEFLKDKDNSVDVYVYSYFDDYSAHMMVMPKVNNKPLCLGEVKLAPSEQRLLNADVEEYIGNSLENYLAEICSEHFIEPKAGSRPVISEDRSYINVTYLLSDDSMDDVIRRSNGYERLRLDSEYNHDSLSVYKYMNYPAAIEVTFTLDDTKVNILSKRIIEMLGEPIAVPTLDDEKQMLKTLTEHTLGCSIEEILKKPGNAAVKDKFKPKRKNDRQAEL